MGGRNPAYTQQVNKKYIKALMFIYWSGIKELWINYWNKFLQNNNQINQNVPGYVCNPGSPREWDAASKR